MAALGKEMKDAAMPLATWVLPDLRLVVARASGGVTDADFRAARIAVGSRAEVRSFRRLADFRDVTSFKATSAYVRQLATSETFDPNALFALVTSSAEVFGHGRMLELSRDRASGVVRIFTDYDEACAWLAVSPAVVEAAIAAESR